MRDALRSVLKSLWVIADFLSFQYISILELLGSVDMMSRNLPYRKYRPMVQVHKNAYIWSEHSWVFILKCQSVTETLFDIFSPLHVLVYVAGGGMWSQAFWRSMWSLDSKCGHGSTSNTTGRWWNVTESSTSPKSPARNPARSCSRRWRWDGPEKTLGFLFQSCQVHKIEEGAFASSDFIPVFMKQWFGTVINQHGIWNVNVTFFMELLCFHTVYAWAAVTS